MNSEGAVTNTDRELWREREDDYYAPSLHVTVGGGIGMSVGGYVIVKPIREWHAAVGWRCKAGSLPSGDVQDCGWPHCSCDPHAERVMGGLLEQGWDSNFEAHQQDMRIRALEAALRKIVAGPPAGQPHNHESGCAFEKFACGIAHEALREREQEVGDG